jgi:hypothetical protein
MVDYHTEQRQAWLRKSRLSDNAMTALAVIAIILAFGVVGSMDYEDALAAEIEAERDAYTWALDKCIKNSGERNE